MQSLSLRLRLLVFLVGCIGLRLLFVVLAKYLGEYQRRFLPYLGYLALLPAFGFLYIFFTGSRPSGPETFGAKIWWNALRPIHAILYLLFAYNAIQGHTQAWMYLLVDVLFGLGAFLVHHTWNGDFAQVL